MSKRSQLLSLFQIAGYHKDRGFYTSLIIENKINRMVAQENYNIGVQKKLNGVACGCPTCNTLKATA